jgi:hypothetical protein
MPSAIRNSEQWERLPDRLGVDPQAHAEATAILHTVPGKHFPQEDQAPAIASQIAEFVLFQQSVDLRA